MKLNQPPKPIYTHEGAKATRINSEQQLRRSVLGCLLWESEFYSDGESIAKRIADTIPLVAAEKVAAIAIEARSQMNLRHVPLLICSEMLKHERHKALVGTTLRDVIQRPDELCEFLAIFSRDRTGTKKLGKIPNQAKKGLAAAFQKFDRYSLSKWSKDGAIKLRDVLFLCHPKPKDDEQAKLWKDLAENKLTEPDTWEKELSAGKGEGKLESWTRLLSEKKLGALALLRNLRNFTEAKVDECLVKERLEDMKTDRVLPFRFISAARYAPQYEPQLEQAMFKNLSELERLKGRTALVIDTSPSMWQANISAKSDMDRFEAAAALAILAREVCEDVRIYAFNEKAYTVPPRRGFALRDALSATKGGYSCGGLAVDAANKEGYDRIIVLTDGQWHVMGASGKLDWQCESGDAQKVSPAPLTAKAYMINVASSQNGVGYGKWISLDGFSESIVRFIQMSEAGDLD